MSRANPALRATVAAPKLSVVAGGGASQRARAYQGFTQQILSGGIRPGQFIFAA